MIQGGMDNAKLINKIQKFAKKRGMTDTEFSLAAVGHRNLVTRLKAGNGYTMRTLDRVEAYMRRGK